jgi:hypothetical protein
MRILGVVSVIGMLAGLALAAPAVAQSPVQIEAPAPEKPPQIRIVEPTPATREATRPREHDFYGADVRVRHEPAFIEPFVGQTEGGTKYGLSGWTAPPTPVGSSLAQGDLSGVFALGVTFIWDTVPAGSSRRVSNPR